jgi:ribosomal protein S12 methylthiotransferase
MGKTAFHLPKEKSFLLYKNTKMKNLHLISLGCPKARVDSELILGLAQNRSWQLCADAEEADAIIINTCGFLQSAIDESIDTILEMADYKSGRCKRLIVAGCMPSRFRENLAELRAELPEVDAFLTTNETHKIIEVLEDNAKMPVSSDIFHMRRLAAAQSYAYLKISEGCDRRCSFCAIPLIRGPQISRSIESLVGEAQNLVSTGCRELVLIAQELTHYGSDIGLKDGLNQLIDELEKIENLRWIRLMYAYPWNFSEKLMQRLGSGKVLPYIDMPLQHVSERILKSMRRGVSQLAQEQLLRRLREIPKLVLRTSLIVGYPGETDAEFNQLLDWIKEVKFDRLGVFTYSPEEGTPAAELPEQIPDELKEARYAQIMDLQQEIHREKMQALLGQTLDILVDGPSPEHPLVLQGRYYGQAPEVDGQVYLSYEDSEDEPANIGSFVKARIVEATDYDLLGHV